MKYSMITDILEGLLFLHNSVIGCHGRFKSANCVIDSRFSVKLTNYGLNEVHKQVMSMEDENFNARSLFWTAPEHLRDKDPFDCRSKKGDIYAFAVVLQEIITRCGPFEAPERLGCKRAHLEPEEILDRLRMDTSPPYRPEVAPDEAPAELLDLMQFCWAEDPNLRPDVTSIKPRLRKITKGISSKNFLDNLLNRMEQYANNLEQIVEEKTQNLMEEKQKTEEILYQLLPRFVAEELKMGKPMIPESFDSVTIFFSDIVGFTNLSAESGPMDVVNLLNDLYSTFDSIIGNYNVYKVETIGDAYMVASGLPIRNGNEHAREISRMSLDIREAIRNFKVRHMPGRKLQIRIGLHSGPCVAGVVGLKMPKYCLFGDTVTLPQEWSRTVSL
ncbi:Atrial natriuretic peptide receptor 1 [Halotydeus destructor]|nr:Atrial natriuretic peptide receptor 1 [Halotydeus destructor]